MILLVLLGLVVAVAFAGIVLRFLVRILQIALATAGALIISAVVVSAFDVDTNAHPGDALGLFLVAFAFLLLLIIRAGKSGAGRVRVNRVWRSAKLPAEPSIQLPPAVAVSLSDEADLRRLESAGLVKRWAGAKAKTGAGERQLAVAWEIVGARATEHRNRISVARGGCDRLLALSGTSVLPVSTIDAIVGIRKGIPEIVAAYLRLALTASPAERGRALDELVNSLERRAARAEREIRTLARDHAHVFATERDHLDRRSDEDHALF